MRFGPNRMQVTAKIIIIALMAAIAAVITAAICFERVLAPVVSKNDYAQILFVGDLMFDRGIRYYADKGGGNNFIFEKISSLLSESNLVVANLEGPITGNKSVSSGTVPGSKENYFFTFDPSLAETLFENNIRIVNLGNNHILNFDYEGLYSTEKFLNQNMVGYFGAPNGPRSISTEIGGVKITLVGYNEFSAIQGVEEKAAIEEIEKAKKHSDIIIVFAHWGVEYSKLATKNQKELARRFIDAGADLIIGSHSHVIAEGETYNNKKIYYSLGNFIFDQYFDENVRNGLGVVLRIHKETKELFFEEKHFYLENNGQTVLK